MSPGGDLLGDESVVVVVLVSLVVSDGISSVWVSCVISVVGTSTSMSSSGESESDELCVISRGVRDVPVCSGGCLAILVRTSLGRKTPWWYRCVSSSLESWSYVVRLSGCIPYLRRNWLNVGSCCDWLVKDEVLSAESL